MSKGKERPEINRRSAFEQTHIKRRWTNIDFETQEPSKVPAQKAEGKMRTSGRAWRGLDVDDETHVHGRLW